MQRFAPAELLTRAQQNGAIAGMVSDATGAVLPGVMVEAASSVLIERVRSAVTSSDGQYGIVDLRPGTFNDDAMLQEDVRFSATLVMRSQTRAKESTA